MGSREDGELVVGVAANGTISAELTGDRELVRVQVQQGWEGAIPASGLGSAVLTAYSDGLSKLPELSIGDLLANPRGFDHGMDSRSSEFGGPPRSVESFSEDLQNTIDQAAAALNDLRLATRAANAPDQSVVRTVAFRLRQKWVVGCKVNPDWAAGKSGTEITQEVMRALELARSGSNDIDPSTAAQERVQQAVQSLMGFGYEAIASLSNPRPTNTNEGG
ncbi:hypothetical protein [Mycobacteroides saopaulense]|uniref:Uncharacterized protein n=1 Tax=Mycobacteroides saopaulense TaxID=1578165 RepID=A0ABX3C3F1_9MYCO|nr:hypothetical protein [Mycobacteroides saopaulense]OHT81318.1 hypothetical protein BKG68_22540 [Mycobacteroides saopaulense]OHU12990.1 hypothetical protein BKG73_05815 [Mycobacteroides saopaulense]